MDPNTSSNPDNSQGAPQQQAPSTPYQQQSYVTGAPQPGQPVVSGYQAPVAPMTSTPQTTGGGGKKLSLIIAIVIGIVFIIGILGVVAVLLKNKTNGSGSGGNGSGISASTLSSQLTTLGQYGSKITASDLSHLNKDTLFYAVFKNTAMQNVVHMITDSYQGSGPTDQTSRSLEYLHNTGFNYKTKELSFVMQSPDGSFITECSGGKQYNYSQITDFVTNTTTSTWQPTQNEDCDSTSYVYNITDGFSVGGLNETQAQDVVAGLSGAKGLIDVKSMSLATHNGAPYVRLVVDVNPINLGADNGYEGLGVFEGEVKAAGINLITWPYGTVGSLGTGAQIIYYINPATKLPAYSQIGLTYSIDDNTGKQMPDNNYDFRDSEYAFGGAVTQPSTTAAPQSVKLSWPEEKF